MAQQLSVFLENSPGRLNDMTKALGQAGVNMLALFVADTRDFGVARIICDKTQLAADALKAAGFSVTTAEVVAVEIPDTPGALGKLFEAIADAGIDIGYAYCFVDPKTQKAVNFCRFKTPHAIDAIEKAGYTVLGDELFHSD